MNFDGQGNAIILPIGDETNSIWLDHTNMFSLAYSVYIEENQSGLYPRITSGSFWHVFELI